MRQIESSDLASNLHSYVARAENGERFLVTLEGRPVAMLQSVPPDGRWMRREDFLGRLRVAQADTALTRDLAGLVSESIDDSEIV